MKYMFNTDPAYLKVTLSEPIKIETIQDHYDYLSLSHYPQRDLKVLIDCSNVKFKVQRRELESVKAPFEKAIMKYNSIQEAIIVDEPYGTVIATLFEQYFPDHAKYNFKIFCTEESAKDWLINSLI